MNKLKSFLLLVILFTVNSYSQDNESIELKDYYGNMNARQIGPAVMSGRISDMENHPTNPKVIYTGTAGGGVWKSDNAGTTFRPIFDDHSQSIGAVELDPNDPDNVIYVGTGEPWPRNSVSIGDGLYKSVDGGKSWKNIGFKNSERISDVIVNPDNSNEIYVGVLGALWSDSEERGVFKSSDGGETWKNILYVNESTGSADLTIDPNNPNIIYASMWEFRRGPWFFESGGESSALYKSIDGGESWGKIHNGFPVGKLGRLAIAVAKTDSNILYTVIEAEKDDDKGLYKSFDGGESWEQVNNDFGITVRPFYFSRIVVDPKNADIVVKAGLYGSISKDGGKTFQDLGFMHADIHDIVFDINNSDLLYVGTDGGVYRSWDKGVTMEIVENLPLAQFYHVTVDDKEPYNVYGGLQDNGSWYAPSFANGGISAKHWSPVGQGDGFRVYKHPTKNIIYSEMQGAENVWRYDVDNNRVKTIQPLEVEGYEKYRFNWNAPISTSFHKPDRFFIGSQYLHVSDDMGDTWKIISPDLTTNDKSKQTQAESGGLSMDNSGAENHTTIFTIAESPIDENVIWVGTDDGNVQLTTDGGKSWKNLTSNINSVPDNTWVYHIEPSVHDVGTAYVVFDGHTTGDMNPYALKTDDFGMNWKNIIPSNDVYGFTRSIQEDYENPDLLFLGTEFGLYISINGGDTWNKFEKNVPPVAIHHIELQKNTNDLVLATHGRGIIIIDDISPLREINKESLSQKLYFFKDDNYIISDLGGFTDSFGRENQFFGPNSNLNAQIKYLLPKRHTFGKMTMEIFDENGKSVINLSPGKSKGMNFVSWNYRMKQPKVAKGKTLARGGLSSPRVKEGKYKLVITKGKDSFTKSMYIKDDPNTDLDSDEKKLKHDTTMKLYNLSEELAYTVYTIDEILSSDNFKKGTKNKLQTLKESLVITTGDNYVGMAKNELREDLLDLFSKISASYDKPSQNDMDNLNLVVEEFDNLKSEYDKIIRKLDINQLELLSFDDFLKN